MCNHGKNPVNLGLQREAAELSTTGRQRPGDGELSLIHFLMGTEHQYCTRYWGYSREQKGHGLCLHKISCLRGVLGVARPEWESYTGVWERTTATGVVGKERSSCPERVRDCSAMDTSAEGGPSQRTGERWGGGTRTPLVTVG